MSADNRGMHFIELLLSVLFGMGIANLCTGFITSHLMTSTITLSSENSGIMSGTIKTSLGRTIWEVDWSLQLGFYAVLLLMLRFYHGNMRLIRDWNSPFRVDVVKEYVTVLSQGVLFAFLGALTVAPDNYKVVVLVILALDVALWFKVKPLKERDLRNALLLMVGPLLVLAVVDFAGVRGVVHEFILYFLVAGGILIGVLFFLRGLKPRRIPSDVDMQEASREVISNWTAINIGSVALLTPLVFFPALADLSISSAIFFGLLLLATGVDYLLDWNYYFPTLSSDQPSSSGGAADE